jgi:hypothetical protein
LGEVYFNLINLIPSTHSMRYSKPCPWQYTAPDSAESLPTEVRGQQQQDHDSDDPLTHARMRTADSTSCIFQYSISKSQRSACDVKYYRL